MREALSANAHMTQSLISNWYLWPFHRITIHLCDAALILYLNKKQKY